MAIDNFARSMAAEALSNKTDISKIDEKVEDLKAQGVQQTPLFAESIEWLNENGDTSKVYVLPDGYIYGYITVIETVKKYTNLADVNDTSWKNDMRLNSSGVETENAGTIITNYIPCKYGDIIRTKGLNKLAHTIWFYSEDKSKKMVYYPANDERTNILDFTEGINTFKAGIYGNSDAEYTAYARITAVVSGDINDVVVTVNEEIKEEIGEFSKWGNTNHAFIPADYEDRIFNLEEDVNNLKNEIESGGSTSVETVAIPEYWKNMVETKTETVKALQEAGGKDCVCFAWASDTHIPDNSGSRTNDIGKVMAKMLDNCEIPFAVISGDVATRASYAEETVYLEKLAELPIHLAPLWGTERLIMALGNHDGCYGDSTGYYRKQFSPERMWQKFFRGQVLDFRRVFSDDGMYFYIDNEAQRTRFIVLNSHFGGDYAVDSNGWAVNNRFGTSCFGQEQLDWLADVALDMPQGYSAVITMHVPPNVNYTVDKEQFIGIVNAYNNKSTYSGSYTTGVDGWTNNSVSVDFTQAKGEIIAVFTGHVHGDSIDTTTLSCPLLTVLSAGATANEPYAETAPTRTKGTDTETNFDIVTINKATRTIYCTRIGAGSDREISY